ncbi:MAG: hypothetical protein AAFZ52_10475, partial [Bacteroidota bacterium]
MFRYLLLLSAIVLFSSTLPGQVYEKALGLEISPHQGNRRLSAGLGVTFQELERQDSLESGLGGFSVGFTYDVRNDKIGYTTGLRYLRTGYEVAQQPTTSDPDSDLT